MVSSVKSLARNTRSLPRFPLESDAYKDIVEWCESNIVLPYNTPDPGPLKLENWQKGILREYQSSRSRQVTLMCSSQIGKSLLMLCIMGYHIGCSPTQMLLVQPDKLTLRRFFLEKINPLVDSSPTIQKSVKKNKAGAISSDVIQYVGGEVFVATAGSKSSTRSVTSQLVLADEVDVYKANLDASNPLDSLRARGGAFDKDSRLIIASTPIEIDQSLVYKEFKKSRMSSWEVPCIHCGVYQFLEWESVRNGLYHCPGCGTVIDDVERYEMVDNGRWVTENSESDRPGYYISQLYSKYKSMSTIAEDFDPANPKGFYTQVLGVPYQPKQFTDVDEEKIARLYTRDRLDKITAVTAAVDVQGDRLEVQVVNWSGLLPQVVRHRKFEKDKEWDRCWITAFKYLRKVAPDMVFIDRQPSKYEIQAYVEMYGRDFITRGRLKLIKGLNRSTFGEDFVITTSKDALKHSLAVDSAKEYVHRLLSEESITFLADMVPHNFTKQLLAEELRMVVRGGIEVPKWVQVFDRNEGLDCLVYNVCARHFLGVEYTRKRKIRARDLMALSQEIKDERAA